MPPLSKNDIGSETSRLQIIIQQLEDYARKLEGKNNTLKDAGSTNQGNKLAANSVPEGNEAGVDNG